jgi:hypothetical protein
MTRGPVYRIAVKDNNGHRPHGLYEKREMRGSFDVTLGQSTPSYTKQGSKQHYEKQHTSMARPTQ